MMAAADKHLSVTIIINDIYPVYELQVQLVLDQEKYKKTEKIENTLNV